jgi:hypothetical protein
VIANVRKLFETDDFDGHSGVGGFHGDSTVVDE